MLDSLINEKKKREILASSNL